jgi:hypothetical protein
MKRRAHRGILVGLVLAASGCAGEAPAPAIPEATASAAPGPPPSAPASAAPPASSAPSASASASSAPAAPAPPNADAILATVPEKAGVIQTDAGLKITVDAQGRVTIEDPNKRLSGSSSCGPNGFVYRRSVRLYAELQDALRAGARDKIVDLVNYPLRVNETHQKHTTFKDRAALLAAYDIVFTDKLKTEVLTADPRAIFCRADGFMLGDGVLWAEVKKDHYGVFVINTP